MILRSFLHLVVGTTTCGSSAILVLAFIGVLISTASFILAALYLYR